MMQENVTPRPEAARLDQIENTLTIMASVVARLAKDVQQSRLHRRVAESDPHLQEDQRVQREIVRSLQARLSHLEERQNTERNALPPPEVDSEFAAQLSVSLLSIRNSLDALAKRRCEGPRAPGLYQPPRPE